MGLLLLLLLLLSNNLVFLSVPWSRNLREVRKSFPALPDFEECPRMARRKRRVGDVGVESGAVSEDVLHGFGSRTALPADVIWNSLQLAEPVLQVRMMSTAKAA